MRGRRWLETLVSDVETWRQLTTERGTAISELLQGLFAALLRGDVKSAGLKRKGVWVD